MEVAVFHKNEKMSIFDDIHNQFKQQDVERRKVEVDCKELIDKVDKKTSQFNFQLDNQGRIIQSIVTVKCNQSRKTT